MMMNLLLTLINWQTLQLYLYFLYWTKEVFDQNLTCILLDLQLYDNPILVSKVFELLISYYRQKIDVYELATEVQILQDAQEIAVLAACELIMRSMKKELEAEEFWLGIESKKGKRKEEQSEKAYIRTRNFMDQM